MGHVSELVGIDVSDSRDAWETSPSRSPSPAAEAGYGFSRVDGRGFAVSKKARSFATTADFADFANAITC